MNGPVMTSCPFCNSALVARVKYYGNGSGYPKSCEERVDVPLWELAAPSLGHEQKDPVIQTIYCPQHRTIFEP